MGSERADTDGKVAVVSCWLFLMITTHLTLMSCLRSRSQLLSFARDFVINVNDDIEAIT